MDFKKIAGDISTSFKRAVQYTEEHLGQAERTQYDPSLEQLLASAEATQRCAETVVRSTEAALQPNPAHRLEDAICERIDRRLRDRKSPLQELGQALEQAGNDLGPGSEYGTALAKVGQAQMRLAQLQYDYAITATEVLLMPLRNFLAGEAKRLRTERRSLEVKRLDLDSARARAAKAQPQAQAQADELCEAARKQFELQLSCTKEALQSVQAAQTSHARCLRDFVEAQTEYHAECLRCMQELQRQLDSNGAGGDSS